MKFLVRIITLCLIVGRLLPANEVRAQTAAEQELMEKMESWQVEIRKPSPQEYIESINSNYLALRPHQVDRALMLELRIARSFWAQRLIGHLVERDASSESTFRETLHLIPRVRGALNLEQAKMLWQAQLRFANDPLTKEVARVIAEHLDHSDVAKVIGPLADTEEFRQRMGPPYVKRLRPARGGASEKVQWADDPAYQNYSFVTKRDESGAEVIDRTAVDYKGMRWKDGDIFLVQTSNPGDGVLTSLGTGEPVFAGHMLQFLVRTRVNAKGEVEYFPGFYEIFEDGVRFLPMSSVLNPRFVWYGEVLRHDDIRPGFSTKMNQALDFLKTVDVSFDFLTRSIPTNTRFAEREDGRSLCCKTLVDYVLFNASHGHMISEKIAEVHPDIAKQLLVFAFDIRKGIRIPESYYHAQDWKRVGIVDNGAAGSEILEKSLAQYLLIGNAAYPYTAVGNLATRQIDEANVPDTQQTSTWLKSRRNLQRSWRMWMWIQYITLGQSQSILGRFLKKLVGKRDGQVPKSASPALISFYLLSELAYGDIVSHDLCESVLGMTKGSALPRLSALRRDPAVIQAVTTLLKESKVMHDGWYKD